ncbi:MULTISPECIES: 5-(carboxyamino)imidazole ribonucleotide synthase [Phyllobacterium]|jgi:5-(carboxyamino)imidazole ribonucleotide synthase|uniref:N5-carboxyaminoimidazole ribonucleotide synthase n=1 Tax=Phyllobacterium sophorae TaxID=1520277 RepID=A0A2P7BK70_9HYPH|nr:MULTISPECIES: 5-(carboxyamino)imidazole ribonucleotide synthase [Phyllobacterium]PSH66857.1 5-(carboxyamino)imidazole ribonucleotide synthase [Phyllobacterium sophorae]UXN65105.1 5-(carboxyamino)imidazole ribonucleotide synthase [Phyllobacterium sp. A18/5-2]
MISPGSTIGIIGGGQLGRMLAMAAARLGYRTVILEPQEDCPAAQVASEHIVAAYDDPNALEQLAELSDVVTYEFENVPVDSVEMLNESKAVFPPPEALKVSQDRVAEKRFLNKAGIQTAQWRIVENEGDLKAALLAFDGKGILKTRRFGYDGKGQIKFTGAKGESAKSGFAAIGSVPSILEALVDFTREISVIAARDEDGNIKVYDIAENVHKDGILATSSVPVSVSSTIAGLAADSARKLLDGLNYVGVVGMEFFVLANGTLLANEFAPRVHNSGHWTEAACAVSQFEQHIRAIAGLPLGDTRRHSDCVMENLIGDDIGRVPMLLQETGAVVHLYGKAEARSGRKMGHVTRITKRL